MTQASWKDTGLGIRTADVGSHHIRAWHKGDGAWGWSVGDFPNTATGLREGGTAAEPPPELLGELEAHLTQEKTA
jgi:hypothetical protein